MHRIIADGTGLIGTYLVEHWLNQRHTLTVIGRSPARIEKKFGTRVQALGWSELRSHHLQSAEVIVNLTGASIGAKRWTKAYKKEVIISRTGSTKKLCTLLAELPDKAPALFNASAMGIYGPQDALPDRLPPRLDENVVINCEQPVSFLSQVGCQWEKAAEPAKARGIRVVFLRFALVMAKEGGVLPQLMTPFQFYIGGPLGSGHQPFSWVAITDVIQAIDFLISRPEAFGPFNIAAPECVQQKIFAKTLGKVMNRPDRISLPAWVLKMVFGKEKANELMLEGQRIYPQRLLDMGFKFTFSNLAPALKYELQKTTAQFLQATVEKKSLIAKIKELFGKKE